MSTILTVALVFFAVLAGAAVNHHAEDADFLVQQNCSPTCPFNGGCTVTDPGCHSPCATCTTGPASCTCCTPLLCCCAVLSLPYAVFVLVQTLDALARRRAARPSQVLVRSNLVNRLSIRFVVDPTHNSHRRDHDPDWR